MNLFQKLAKAVALFSLLVAFSFSFVTPAFAANNAANNTGGNSVSVGYGSAANYTGGNSASSGYGSAINNTGGNSASSGYGNNGNPKPQNCPDPKPSLNPPANNNNNASAVCCPPGLAFEGSFARGECSGRCVKY